MEKEYEEAKNYGRYDKKRECYLNSKGEPVVHRKEVVFNDVLAVIPLSGEYYSKVAKDKDYVKKLDKIIRDVMTASLRQRDEERMKKNVESLVDELKQIAEEKKVEDDLKKKEEVDEKLERSVEVIDGDDAAEEKQKKEADQKQTEEKAEMPISEVFQKKDDCQKEYQSSLAQQEEVAGPCV
ncbi:stress response protein NST1-like [Helianthus annuus]|uniref:stress response protein NST1-like n=1 Tax=Helianthus annuus TaxID=4232 RepID=UPI000B9008CD|nr:stress response protein NST1-like [Helianthus annuus]